MASLELRDVSKAFGGNQVLRNLNLKVEDNEFFCLFGPPTSGKSTVLRLLLGLTTPDSGQVLIDGRDVTASPVAERDLAMVFQNLALFPHLTAFENLAFPLRERKVAQAAIEERIAFVADKLQIRPLLPKLPAQLSGGERQRVAIGRALVRDPAAFLMDEPIAALDARLRETARVELKRLQREVGHTLIYVTHDQEEAMSVADRIAIIGDGEIVQIGRPDEVYDRPASRYVAQLVGSPPMNFFPGTLRDGRFRSNDSARSLTLGGQGEPGAIDLGVRPEDIEVLAAQASGCDWPARISEVEPLGAFTIVDLCLDDGSIAKAQLPGQPRFAPGQQVWIRFDPAHARLFDAAGGQRIAS